VGKRTKCKGYSQRNISSLGYKVSVKQSGSQLGDKCFSDDEEVEEEIRKWLRQQSKYFFAAGFDARVKRWDKCINVSGRYVEE
jgi:hypothetical protein